MVSQCLKLQTTRPYVLNDTCKEQLNRNLISVPVIVKSCLGLGAIQNFFRLSYQNCSLNSSSIRGLFCFFWYSRCGVYCSLWLLAVYSIVLFLCNTHSRWRFVQNSFKQNVSVLFVIDEKWEWPVCYDTGLGTSH